MSTSKKVNDWSVNVKFQGNGALLATATGVLLAPPKVAVALVTDAAGDPLFRVVERKELAPGVSGGRRVEVVNKAAIRVLAWKLWSKSTVVYEIERSEQEPETLAALLRGLQLEQQEESVSFELKSGNMLQSLTGKWSLQPIRLHTSALPHDILTTLSAATPTAGAHRSTTGPLLQSSATSPALLPAATKEPGAGLRIKTKTSATNSSSGSHFTMIGSPTKAKLLEKLALLSPTSRRAAAAGDSTLFARPVVEITARTSSGPFTGSSSGIDNSSGSILGAAGPLEGFNSSSSSSSSGGLSAKKTAGNQNPEKIQLPPGLVVDADGYVMATYVHYEQLAQPRGMPPAIRYVPGLSDAVAASIGREVRQMLDKVSCVTDMVVAHNLSPQAALTSVVQAVETAGGSFKALQKALRKQIKIQQQQQQLQDPAIEGPSSPFSWLKASSAFSPTATAASKAAALLSSPAAAAAFWGEGANAGRFSPRSNAGVGRRTASGAGRKSSGAGRKTSAAGRRVSAAASAAAAAGGAGADGVTRLLVEDVAGFTAREVLSHPVILAEGARWTEFDD